ncbi:related to Phosphatidylglycerophosphatase GEP4, mitochondrial [Hanseniaspora guilliermondii]|uniref:Related to Phosphatidylglycerophosphatase GEP4, mitochondrial n=1 Tax=Hanseniaspora guilliermondii TaxID=56406 RepID=A0A1L0B1J7_9ASCO|nr:related to Phosphatidylglycerophosphatase GEP4, mitochondrial [Hanseniaspora guilliermondii]
MINFSSIANIPRIIFNPKLLQPSLTYQNFNEINFELLKTKHGIKYIVLDKDNCISADKSSRIYPLYLQNNWNDGLLKHFPLENILIVSNSMGSSDDPGFSQVHQYQRNYQLDSNTSSILPILKHNYKKPGCQSAIIHHFENTHPNSNVKSEHIAVIGDRLFTDILMANQMKSLGVYLQQGVMLKKSSPWIMLEQCIYNYVFLH